ncbi:MAG: CPBP family intramembrane metalloprotease [Rhodospirillaceae bacterium]|nr:CPBP family intramembrane metalloprotease [Rhodospirillaceae bacterium]
MNNRESAKSLSGIVMWLIILLSPNFINDLFLLGQPDPIYWLQIDYVTRLSTFVIVLLVPEFRRVVQSALTMQNANFNWWLGAAAVASATLLFDYLIGYRLYLLFGGNDAVLFSYPKISEHWLKLFDLSIGLALVAVAEEITCRGIFKYVLEKFTKNKILIILISSFVFAAFHWSHGPAAMITAFFTGILLMVLYMRAKSLLPPIFAHYIINLVYFI